MKWLPKGAIFSNPTCNVGWKQVVQTMACYRHELSKKSVFEKILFINGDCREYFSPYPFL